MNQLLHKDLTYAIIGAAMDVHKHLGSGFLEAVYENALAHEFDLRDIAFQRQHARNIHDKGQPAGTYVADFVVEDLVIVELKAMRGLTAIDEAQLLNYLKASDFRVGLLINFGSSSLQHRRRVI
jgi:GxxExxY protein